jgi:uncharacterized protein YmfQ (DUF2313 family)
MATPTPNTSASYLTQLLSLLPRGRVWPRDASSTLVQTLSGLTPSVARMDGAACGLVGDAFPATTVALLPEWEQTLGLPDPCVGPYPSLAKAQASVAAKLGARGGASAGYFIGLAAALGYTITIQTFAPARFGRATMGSPMRGTAWAYAWQVTAPYDTIRPAAFGSAPMGSPFRAWNSPVLECQIMEVAPAHATVIFNY